MAYQQQQRKSGIMRRRHQQINIISMAKMA